jgi:hypothetical protein
MGCGTKRRKTMFKKLKTITSYVGLGRWLSETEEDGAGWLACCDIPWLASPYHYSPTKMILKWNGKNVIYSEVSHKRYEVYEVPAEAYRYKSDEEATDHHVASSHVASI